MASQLINIIVNSKGVVTVRKELEAMGNTARQTATYLSGMRAILAAALTFSGAGAITEVVDNFIVLQNRLRQVSDASETVGQSWSRLMQIANNSYSTIDNTVNLYFRVAQAYRSWGESASAAADFTELFQKAAILSGSSMQTTSQAVYQFSQALNKGKLDGDEFRSVLEGLPYVATVIQKSLGVTRAELYNLSKEGKISVKTIKKAFQEAAAAIKNDWSNITPTIGMALIVLQNNWTDFIGEIQTSTGIFSGIAQVILLVANNFDLLAIALSPVAISLGFLAGRLGIGLVVIGFRDLYTALKDAAIAMWGFNAASLANPYVLAIAAIAAIVAALVYFRNEIGLTDEVLNKMWQTAVSVFNSIVAFLTPVVNSIISVVKFLIEWNLWFIAIRKVATVLKDVAVALFAALVSGIVSFGAYMKKSLAPLFNTLMELTVSWMELVNELVRIFKETLGAAIKALLPVFKSVWEYIEPALKKFINFTNDVLTGWKNIATYLKNNFLPFVKDVFEGWILIINKVISAVRTLIDTITAALSKMSLLSKGSGGSTGKVAGANYGAQFYAGEFASGGSFSVGGTGAGRDTTPVAFRANRGERVTVETRRQQRANDNAVTAANDTVVKVPVQINNVFDPALVPAANESASGQRSILNVILANRDEVNSILGVV